LGPHFYFYCPRHSIVHLPEKKRSSAAPDQDVLGGFRYTNEVLSEEDGCFPDGFSQEPDASHIPKDGRQYSG